MSEGTQTHPMDIYEISDRELQVLEEAATDSRYITLAPILTLVDAAFITAVVLAVVTFGSATGALVAVLVIVLGALIGGVVTFGSATGALVAVLVIMLGAMIGVLISALFFLGLGIQKRRKKRRIIKNLVQEIRSRKAPV